MWATLVIVFIALSFWLLFRFYQVVFILFISIVIGTVIRPAVSWLHRRGIPRMGGVILVFILLFSLLVGFVLVLFPLIIEQGATIVAAVPGYYQVLRDWMGNFPNQLIVRLGQFLPPVLPGLASAQPTGQQILATASQVLDYIVMAVKVLFVATAIFLLAFNWTLEGPRSIQALLMLIPMNIRLSYSELISAMETKIGFYIVGQSVLCLIIGVMALIAYLIIGLPNALVLALIAGVFEAVPMVGPLLGAIPAGIIALSISPTKLIWVIVATVIIQQLENTLLVPRVMRRAVGVNPFVSLLAIFAFSSLFGIAGALMAIPIAATIQLLLDRFVFHLERMEPEETPLGRDIASRLRNEANDLVLGLRRQARIKKGGSDLRITQIDQAMDEIEAIATDLDALLAQVHTSGES